MYSIEEIRLVAEQGPYYPKWESLNQFEVPRWFRQAKFGVFIHWGLYSVPAFNNEWYARNMYIKGYPEFDHHRKTYGLQTQFGFKDFIPMFTGKKFNANEWVSLFQRAGAKYIIPVAEHHDGFQMYSSDISHFNAFEMGPKRDILKELKQASEQFGVSFGVSSHRAEHWFFLGHGKEFDSDVNRSLKKGDLYWPAMPEPDNEDLFSIPYPHKEFLEDWLARTCELIDNTRPKLLYFDWWIQHDAFKDYLKLAAAYYYNRGVEWQQEVGICYKHDAMMFGSGIVEIERGAFSKPQPFYWQTDTSIARNSWCYTTTLDYKEPKEIIHNLIEVVSKNGNLLLNVGPMGDGSFAEQDQKILLTIGKWLAINGEGIYDAKPWRVSGEGATTIRSGQFQEQTIQTYTVTDIRFTTKGDAVYAFMMEMPIDGRIVIRSLGDSIDQNKADFHGIINEVSILGYEGEIKWTKDTSGLKVFYDPTNWSTGLPIVCKIRMK